MDQVIEKDCAIGRLNDRLFTWLMCVNLFHGQPPWRKNPVQRALGRQAKPHQPFSLYVFRWTMSEEVGESNHASWTIAAVSTWRRAIPSRMPKISVPLRGSVSQSCPSGPTADWLIDWSLEGSSDYSIDWSITWVIYRWIDYLIESSMDWLFDRLLEWLIDRLIHW